MAREEGHYTIKRVDRLPTRGNSNWLYILKDGPIDRFYRWLLNGSWEEIPVDGSIDYISNVELNGTDLEFTGVGLAFNNSVDLSSLGGGSFTLEGYNETGSRIGGDLIVTLGDYDNSANGAFIEIDDANDTVKIGTEGSGDTDLIVHGTIISNVGEIGLGRTNTALITSENNNPLITDITIDLPNIGVTPRVLPISINGNYADNSGNITLFTGDYSEWATFSGTRVDENLIVTLGDYDGLGNSTRLEIDDLNNWIKTNTDFILDSSALSIKGSQSDLNLGGSTTVLGSYITSNENLYIQTSNTTPASASTRISLDENGIGINANNVTYTTDNRAYLKTSNLTSIRNFEFPDNSGTIALISDIESILHKSSTVNVSRNALLTDADGMNDSTAESDITITIEPNVVTNFPVGTVLTYRRNGSGNVIIAYSGVTGDVVQTYTLHDTISIWQSALDVWEILNPPKFESETIAIPSSDLITDLVTGTTLGYYNVDFDCEILELRLTLLDAGTGTGMTVDINVNASTILSTKLTTDATEETSDTATIPAVLTSTSLLKGDKITIDHDIVPTSGKGVITQIKVRRI